MIEKNAKNNGPLQNEKSQQILPKSRNLAQPSNGSRSLRFCACRSHICFSIKSLNFSVSVSDSPPPILYEVNNYSMKFHNKEIHAILPNWLSCVDRAGKCFFFAFMAFSCLRGGPFDFCGGRGEGGSIGLCKNFFPLASVAGDFFQGCACTFL